MPRFYVVDVPPTKPPTHGKGCACLRCRPVSFVARTYEEVIQRALPLMGGEDPAQPPPAVPPPPPPKAPKPPRAVAWKLPPPPPAETASPPPPGGFRAWKRNPKGD